MNLFFSKRKHFEYGYDDILWGIRQTHRNIINGIKPVGLNINKEYFYRWEYKLKPFLKGVFVEYKFENGKWIKIREI